MPSKPILLRLVCLVAATWLVLPATAQPIDREALVRRHNPTASQPDPLSPFSVGNGEFAFTADITGLQTFPEAFNPGIPLHTQSQWGWHSFPNPEGYKIEQALVDFDVHGRKVPYAGTDSSPAAKWLRGNPHRLDLGRVGLILKHADGRLARLDELAKVDQKLDLWTGILTSRFEFDGRPVKVRTACHPRNDEIAVAIESPLLARERIGVSIAFPGGKADWRDAADWTIPDAHRTVFDPASQTFTRTLDATRYLVRASTRGGTIRETKPHHFEWFWKDASTATLSLAFSPQQAAAVHEADAVFTASTTHWKNFWSTGGAVDLSGSTDSRANELERRIVLSQYLTAIQCSGSMPPQETGLTFNSWFGKPHTEMHWWHAAQFALWGRVELLEKSLPWYDKILPAAEALAKRQGYKGARWPKMVGPEGEESPSVIAGFLIWEQPHPIYYAELCYRAHPDRQTLERYRNLVFKTAEFMASYAWWNEDKKRYELGPALIPAQECHDPAVTRNPTFELAYWHWGLGVAQQWRERLGLPRDPEWDKVIQHLAKPHIRDGLYTAVENAPYNETHDHFSILNAYGFLPPTPLIDPPVMNRTLDWVNRVWQWDSTWGWDYPTMAMTAARLNRPEEAVNALMKDVRKNTFLPNGHNYQDARLPVYLPGNGGLLAAIALMAAGWDGAPARDAPGFPKDGSWKVRAEGLLPMP